ncbi:MAG: hypothetical protein KJ600_04910 [Nanoarchaeota archaeon]|nr:hypothetical protein [Nanoarchaeota archaeon]
MIKKLGRYLSKRSQEKWWDDHEKEARRTEGQIEGLGVREEMARSYYDDGKYSAAAEVWDDMAQIASKYPSTEDDAPKYRQMAEKVRHRAERKSEDGGLEKGVALVLLILGLAGGIFLLSSNITGYVIANLSQGFSNWLGVILLLVGIVGGFFWVRGRKVK